jgi:hypothetical protein
LLQAVVASAALTAAASAGADSLGGKAAPRKPTPKAEDAAPPPNVTLAIEASTPRGPWKMRVTNQSDVPVAIVADARLLALDVTPRSARKAEHCELPSEMRPEDDLSRPLVLPPKRSYAERFEPRLYCLEGSRLEALAPGAIVIATLGWAGHGTHPPLMVSPVEGLEAQVASSKSIRSAPIALPDEPTPSLTPQPEGAAPASTKGDASASTTADASASTTADASVSRRVEADLVVRSATSVDAASSSDIAIPVTLTNKGRRAAIVRFRPETLGFDVVGPRGADHCSWSALPSAPTRDLFTTLGAGAQTSLTVLLSAYCSARVLARSGLYVVRASLDTRRASGAEIGLRSFDGQVIATSPTVVRLRRGTEVETLAHPSLER